MLKLGFSKSISLPEKIKESITELGVLSRFINAFCQALLSKAIHFLMLLQKAKTHLNRSNGSLKYYFILIITLEISNIRTALPAITYLSSQVTD